MTLPPPEHPGAPLLHERIGPYVLLDVLGEGGMGVVYRAEQTEPVKRKVALKLIRQEIASPDVISRFEAERQALAVMEHPAIAKVLDGGTTETGNPYFVMEHVEGRPFTNYCDAHQLTTRERLDLFVPVCEAVQHAHQKGVIHRDLKPSNVLVTEQAGSPQPKVIDFGIAKALGQKLTERTLATEFGAIMGTPAYMSPEQAEGSGLDVDTRTDVYSLGVMLYEALVGKLPVDPAELGFMPFLAQLLARESNPPTPSARVRKMNGDRTSLAALRRVDARRFASELSGDLDWIVMKAIAPERERRYETAQAFAADVRRFLADEPIEARPPSTTYRLKKFVKRNTVGVIASAAAVVALVVGVVAATVGLVRATRAEANARTAQGQAEQEAQTAARVSDFLVGLFKVSDPGEARGNTITAREILDRGVARIDSELVGEPVVQARLMTTMGQVYNSLGFRVPAESLYRKALALREAELGPEDPDVAESLARLSGFLENVRGASDSEVQRLAERALCDEAVAAASEQDRPAILDSRGLAKALAGDTASAIADFEAYLATRDSAAPDAVQRRAWVEALQAGQNPFTEDELNKLRF